MRCVARGCIGVGTLPSRRAHEDERSFQVFSGVGGRELATAQVPSARAARAAWCVRAARLPLSLMLISLHELSLARLALEHAPDDTYLLVKSRTTQYFYREYKYKI